MMQVADAGGGRVIEVDLIANKDEEVVQIVVVVGTPFRLEATRSGDALRCRKVPRYQLDMVSSWFW